MSVSSSRWRAPRPPDALGGNLIRGTDVVLLLRFPAASHQIIYDQNADSSVPPSHTIVVLLSHRVPDFLPWSAGVPGDSTAVTAFILVSVRDVAAVGHPELIRGSWINLAYRYRGTTSARGRCRVRHQQPRAAFITPVPGRVGPMTIAILLGQIMAGAFDIKR
jgi:Tetrahydrofolate dehydrogenase/cyclohydrolase, NAD(P)-binding domain